MSRHVLEESKIHTAIREKVSSTHREVVDEVVQAIAKHDVVVVGMAQNPHPRRARNALTKKGVPFHYIEHGSYMSEWRPRLALKMFTGWPTFPMIFVKGTFVGGASDLEKLIESGELDTMLRG